MVETGETYRHGEHGPVEVLNVRTTMDRVISDGALTKTLVVDFDAEYDPERPGAKVTPAAVETETLDSFITNVEE